MKRLYIALAVLAVSLPAFAAYEVPYQSNMTENGAISPDWTTVDVDGDAGSLTNGQIVDAWTYPGSSYLSYFTDEYPAGLQLYSRNAQPNDKLVSPSIHFESGKEYNVKFAVRKQYAGYTFEGEAYICAADDVNGETVLKKFGEFSDFGSNVFSYIGGKFSVDTEGDYRIVLYVTNQSYRYGNILFVSDFSVSEYVFNPAAPSGLSCVAGTSDNDRALSLTLNWTNPTTDVDGIAFGEEKTVEAINIYRDGEENPVAVITDGASTWTDTEATGLTNGYHSYEVEAVVSGLVSPRVSVSTDYVGEVLPFDVPCSVKIGSSGDFSLLWSSDVVGKWSFENSAEGNRVKLTYSRYNSVPEVWLFTPKVKFAAAGSYKISLRAVFKQISGTPANNSFKVAIGKDASSESVQGQIISDALEVISTMSAEASTDFVEFEIAEPGDYYIGLYAQVADSNIGAVSGSFYVYGFDVDKVQSPAYEVPYQSYMTENEGISPEWKAVDVNGDGNTLTTGKNAGQVVEAWSYPVVTAHAGKFDAEHPAGLVLSTYYKQPDDKLVSPLIHLEAEKEYTMSFAHRIDYSSGWGMDVSAYVCGASDTEGAVVLKDICSFALLGTQDWEYSGGVFTVDATGDYRIVLHISKVYIEGVTFYLSDFNVVESVFVPAAPSDFTAVAGTSDDPDALSVTLSWTNPTTDVDGNVFGANRVLEAVNIYRDGGEEPVAVVSDGASTWTDTESTGLTNGSHSYEIYAVVSGVVSSGVSVSVNHVGGILPYDVPCDIVISSAEDFNLMWSVDKNDYNYDWEFDATSGDRLKLRYNQYINNDNTSWLFTPAVNFPQAGTYRIALTAFYKGTGDDPSINNSFKVAIGRDRTIDSVNGQIISEELEIATGVSDGAKTEFAEFEISDPGVYYVGLHAQLASNISGYFYFYGFNIDVVEKVSTPEFSVDPGEVEAGTAVEITTATEGATIYYTLDGTEPTSDSAVYEEPVYVDKSLTIKAVAEMEGMLRSDVAVGEYTVSGTSDEKELTATVIMSEQTWTEYTKDAVINWVATDGTEFQTSAVINGSTYPRKYQDVYLRVYSSNGNVITVNAPDGYQFVSVGVYSNRDAVIIDGSEVSSVEGVAVYVFPDNKKTSFTIESIKVDSTIKNTDIREVDLVISKIGDGIGSVSVGDNTPVEYYNLQGVRLSGENLPSGLYIRRQGNSVTKVIVR